jgi:hypothetical protein
MAIKNNFINTSVNVIKGHWKPIVWGLIPVILVVIIFSLPLKTVPVEVIEKYTATEMKQEPYTAQETYTDVENYTTQEIHTDTVYDSWTNTSPWNYSFQVNKSGATVTVATYGTASYSYTQPFIFYSGNGTYPYYYPDYGRWWPWEYGSGSARIVIKVSYPEDVIRQRTVTKTRDITKYREVPVQVQKERKVIQYQNVSIWSYLFMDQKK